MSRSSAVSTITKTFDVLNFCSNRVEGYRELIVGENGMVPLTIEAGIPPVLTMHALLPSGKSMMVLSRNVSLAGEISVSVSGSTVKVFALQDLVISITAESPTHASIDSLDLRPLGLNIFGNDKALTVGTMQISRSTFVNMGSVVSIGP